MVIRLVVSRAAVGLFAVGLGVAVSGEAFAQANVLKECGSRYQAKKAANELAGQTWQDFLKECRASLAEPAPAAEEPEQPGDTYERYKVGGMMSKVLADNTPSIICPEETGDKPNCLACGYCFEGKRNDVTFLQH